MNIEIRKSFTKDADKLPAVYKRQLAVIINEIEIASQPSQLDNCKKLTGYKTLTGLEWDNTGLAFISKTKLQS